MSRAFIIFVLALGLTVFVSGTTMAKESKVCAELYEECLKERCKECCSERYQSCKERCEEYSQTPCRTRCKCYPCVEKPRVKKIITCKKCYECGVCVEKCRCKKIIPSKECYYTPETCFYSNPATKLGRGVVNGATCWMEIPKQIYLESSECDPLTGLIIGTGKGVIEGTLRALSGALDIATFLLPPYDQPLICPEFVFEGWEPCI